MKTEIGRSPAEGCVLVIANHYTAEEVEQYQNQLTAQLNGARLALEVKKQIGRVLAEVAKSEQGP